MIKCTKPLVYSEISQKSADKEVGLSTDNLIQNIPHNKM